MEKVENILAKRIDAAGENADYDESCKQLLSNKQILARILKSCVAEFADCPLKDIEEKYIEGTVQISERVVHQDEDAEFIRGTNTEDASMKEGTIFYDIRFDVVSPKDGRMIRMLVNVESQNRYNPGYPLTKRGIYYCSRMISRLYGTEFTRSHYEKLKKVYSIWICMNPPREIGNTITEYSVTEKNLVGRMTEEKENYDLLSVIMVCLGRPDDKNYEGLLKMLDVLLSDQIQPKEKKDVLKSEFDVELTEEMERTANSMCNLSQGIVERTIDQTTVEYIIRMMDNSTMSEKECMALLGISEERQAGYHEMVQEKLEQMKELQPV